MAERKSSVYRGSMGQVLQEVKVRFGTYQLAQVRCNKKTCRFCNGTQRAKDAPSGHGPYWYLLVRTRAGVRRLYIGKVLDVTKYVKGGQSIDWEAVNARRQARRAQRKSEEG